MTHRLLRRLLLRLAATLLALAACAAASAQVPLPSPSPHPFTVRVLTEEELRKPRKDGPLQVLGLDDRPALREEIENLAFEARSAIRKATRVDWEGTAFIVWAEDEGDYFRMTRKRPEFTAAAANAAKRTVWINASAWKKAEPGEHVEILAHEFGHLLLGTLPGGGGLPLWAEEGIVQHLAGEWSPYKSLLLYRGHAFGTLPRLDDLEVSFPEDPERQAIAYAMGYKAIEAVASEYGDRRGEIRYLVQRLADPSTAPGMREALWGSSSREQWNAEVLRSLGSRRTAMFIVATSGSAIWAVILALAVAAWVVVKLRRARDARREAEEEAWAQSLDDDAVQQIYGDREERFGAVEETPWERHVREKEERGE